MGCSSSCIAANEPLTPEQIKQREQEAFDAMPAAPGWVPFAVPGAEFKSTVCHFPVHLGTGGWGDRTAQLAQVHQAIGAAADSGFRCKEVFLPSTTTTNGNSYITIPADCDIESADLSRSRLMARSQLLFERIDPSDGPLETVIQTACLVYSQKGVFVWDPIQVKGYEEMYAALKHIGAQGYTLSTIIEDPSQQLSWSTKSVSIQFVCQRPKGVASPPKAYHVTNVPIKQITQMFPATRVSAQMPMLTQVLDEWYGARRCKLASVYAPTANGLAKSTGMASAQYECHLIFEEAPDGPYTWLLVDSTYTVHRGVRGSTVNHDGYLQAIRNAIAKGWQLAGLIDLPDGEIAGFSSHTSSVKLIFQAKAAPSAPVVQATVVAATPVSPQWRREATPTLVVPSTVVR